MASHKTRKSCPFPGAKAARNAGCQSISISAKVNQSVFQYAVTSALQEAATI